MKRFMLKSQIGIFILIFTVACTDLEIEETDSIIAESETEFTGLEEEEVQPFIDNLYNSLRGIIETQEDLYALNEVTTDELLVPTRGTDWGDNGIWRKLHEHTWDPIHDYVLNNWNNLNQLVFNATLVIDERSETTAEQLAQAKFVRAWAMFWVMDMYGQVPFRTPDEGQDVDPSVKTRAEAFDFVLEDLNTALPDLPSVGGGAAGTTASKASLRFLLSKMYLNKHIYLGNAEPAAEDMNQVIALVDEIANEGYQLQEGYFELFEPSADTETILFTTSSVGNRMWNGLHYNQNAPGNDGGGWNGWCTLGEFYEKFEGDPDTNAPNTGQEERRGFVPTSGIPLPDGLDPDEFDENEDGLLDGSNIGYGFLFGQQFDLNGSEQTDRAGNPLSFTKSLPALTGNSETTGIRTIKYHPTNGAFQGHQIIFRYADAHLMKAEALFRTSNTGEALEMINELRAIRKASALASLNEDDIIDERGRELYKEFWRRNDLIRFGKFSQPWELKVNNDEFRNLFPIPQTALLSNPNLAQNPGY